MRFSLLLVALLLLGTPAAAGEEPRSIPLHLAYNRERDVVLPWTGGVPLPRGALASAEHCRVLNRGEEIPAQIFATARWPDESVKWLLVDLVLARGDAKGLRLEYGPEVRRAVVADPLAVERRGADVEVTGPGLSARVDGNGRLARLVISGKSVLPQGLDLVFDAVRTSGPDAFPGSSMVCADPEARTVHGEPVGSGVEVEVAGPLRVRVLVRGTFRVPGWGSGLPERVRAHEPAERVPFTVRYEFHRGLPVVTGSHQFVFSGEPDRDFITRIGLDLPGQGAGTTLRTDEPGITLRDRETVPGLLARRGLLPCAAPIADGFVLIREGFENRPCLVGGEEDGPARVDFWSPEAGVLDLRRYAREWGVGETGRRDHPEDMEHYARYAARGLAKSHRFVLHFGGAGAEDEIDDRPAAYARPALLLAPREWYAQSGALGRYLVKSPDPAHREFSAGVRRYLDYFLTCQRIYRWYGKLEYGFWQTRYGEIHRNDRFDRDYGRWGWSLGDGAGRIGHVLLLEFLRSGERRYFDAGAAWCRAVYDTSMVHTETHLENARANWWLVRGCNHRHNVQPFGGPYIGLRGSYPGGHRILYFLTGDGVIRDGLDLVTRAAHAYATVSPGACGASGGPDGQGAGALALLFGFETTLYGEYLHSCRRLLDRSGLFPPADPDRLGYGADFGLFLAGGEYLDLTGDEEFKKRFLATADAALEAKGVVPYLTLLAEAFRLTGEEKYSKAVERGISSLDFRGSLAELPQGKWPGHGGALRPPSRANVGRDLPYALAALDLPAAVEEWPGLRMGGPAILSTVPAGWPRPARERRRPLALQGRKRLVKAGVPRFPDDLPFADPEPFVWLSRGDPAGLPVRTVLNAPGDGVKLGLRIERTSRGGASRRVVMAVAAPPGRERVAAFGVEIPFSTGGDPHAVQVTAAGNFRVERWRVDQSDEKIPGWLNSDTRTRWPLWRGGGILLGPDESYRIFKQSRPDCRPLFVDQGVECPGWFDVTDRGGETRRGISARLHDSGSGWEVSTWRGVTWDQERGRLQVWFHSPHAAPLRSEDGPFIAAVEILPHDGWRPPLLPPALTEPQFRKFLDDLDYRGNIGLFALRFLFSETHQVQGEEYQEMLVRSGIEPRRLLHSMLFRDALRVHCEKIGVRYDRDRLEETIDRVIDYYR